MSGGKSPSRRKRARFRCLRLCVPSCMRASPASASRCLPAKYLRTCRTVARNDYRAAVAAASVTDSKYATAAQRSQHACATKAYQTSAIARLTGHRFTAEDERSPILEAHYLRNTAASIDRAAMMIDAGAPAAEPVMNRAGTEPLHVPRVLTEP